MVLRANLIPAKLFKCICSVFCPEGFHKLVHEAFIAVAEVPISAKTRYWGDIHFPGSEMSPVETHTTSEQC